MSLLELRIKRCSGCDEIKIVNKRLGNICVKCLKDAILYQLFVGQVMKQVCKSFKND